MSWRTGGLYVRLRFTSLALSLDHHDDDGIAQRRNRLDCEPRKEIL